METKLTKTELEATNAGTVTRNEARTERRPVYTVTEGDNGYTVEVVMPGVAKEDCRVEVENKQLWIRGRRSDPGLPEGKYLYREIPVDDYALRLNLNADIRTDGISAKVEQGLLRLWLPVAEEALPREITVE